MTVACCCSFKDGYDSDSNSAIVLGLSIKLNKVIKDLRLTLGLLASRLLVVTILTPRGALRVLPGPKV
jgi:hypothetical protein